MGQRPTYPPFPRPPPPTKPMLQPPYGYICPKEWLNYLCICEHFQIEKCPHGRFWRKPGSKPFTCSGRFASSPVTTPGTTSNMTTSFPMTTTSGDGNLTTIAPQIEGGWPLWLILLVAFLALSIIAIMAFLFWYNMSSSSDRGQSRGRPSSVTGGSRVGSSIAPVAPESRQGKSSISGKFPVSRASSMPSQRSSLSRRGGIKRLSTQPGTSTLSRGSSPVSFRTKSSMAKPSRAAKGGRSTKTSAFTAMVLLFVISLFSFNILSETSSPNILPTSPAPTNRLSRLHIIGNYAHFDMPDVPIATRICHNKLTHQPGCLYGIVIKYFSDDNREYGSIDCKFADN